MGTPGKQSLDEILMKGQAVQPKAEEPDPDAVMQALGPCAWCFVKPTFAMDIEDGAKPVQTFQFVYLSIRSVFTPEKFTVWFGERGREQWELVVTGRNLRPIYDRLVEHRIRRIRVLDRDFGHDKEPVITSILVEEVIAEE